MWCRFDIHFRFDISWPIYCYVVQVAVGNMNKFNANEDITQKIIFMQSDSEKDAILEQFLEEHPKSKCLIFMGRTKQCKEAEEWAHYAGYHGTSIHGKKNQKARKPPTESIEYPYFLPGAGSLHYQ